MKSSSINYFFLAAMIISAIYIFLKFSGKKADKAEEEIIVAQPQENEAVINREPLFDLYGTWTYVVTPETPYEWKIAPPDISIYRDKTMSALYYESRYNGVISKIDVDQITVRITSIWAEGDEQEISEDDREWTLKYNPNNNLLEHGNSSFIKRITPSEIGNFDAPLPLNSDNFYQFSSFITEGSSHWDFGLYVEEFTASSTLAPQGRFRYDAKNLLNNKHRAGGDRSVAWSEGVRGHGIGEKVNMRVKTLVENPELDDKINFTSLMIVNGYAKNETVWKNNSRVKVLRLFVGDNYWCDLHLDDIIKPQIFHFTEHFRIYPQKHGKEIPLKGNFITNNPNYNNRYGYQLDLTFEIIDVYPGAKFQDTCITGIALDVYGGMTY